MSEENSVENTQEVIYLLDKVVDNIAIDEQNVDFVLIKVQGDEAPVRMHKNLFKMMQSNEPLKDVTLEDVRWTCMAKQFLSLMVEWELSVGDATNVGRYMNNLIRNSYVDATKKLWDNNIEDKVPLKLVQNVLEYK